MSFDGVLGTLSQWGLSKELIIIIISALPIVELRGSVPVAINLFHFPWYHAFLLSIVGNLIPVPILLLFFDKISKPLSRIGIFARFLRWLDSHARRRGKMVERYKHIGLAIFVAVPVPFTGAWTGSLAANVFGIKFKPALISIFIGICLAGAIVMAFSLLAEKVL